MSGCPGGNGGQNHWRPNPVAPYFRCRDDRVAMQESSSEQKSVSATENLAVETAAGAAARVPPRNESRGRFS